MLIIGLTGSFGTGKSTVAAMFKQSGAAVISADEVTRDLIAPKGKCYKKVAKLFPYAILANRSLDRAALAKIVFNNPRELKKLTDTLYPEALKHVKEFIKQHKHKKLIVLDVPLLFEAKWDRLTNINITVSTNQRLQKQRLQKKWGLSTADIRARLKSQWPLTLKKQMADIVINNNGSLSQTRACVKRVIKKLEKINKAAMTRPLISGTTVRRK